MKKTKTIKASKKKTPKGKSVKLKTDTKNKLANHIAETERLFKMVFERLDRIEKMVEDKTIPVRRNMWIEETSEKIRKSEDEIIF